MAEPKIVTNDDYQVRLERSGNVVSVMAFQGHHTPIDVLSLDLSNALALRDALIRVLSANCKHQWVAEYPHGRQDFRVCELCGAKP